MVGYHEIDKVMGVSRGFGLYGDMVIFLKDTTKLEMRSVPECVPTLSDSVIGYPDPVNWCFYYLNLVLLG